jgi:hypothetical protein
LLGEVEAEEIESLLFCSCANTGVVKSNGKIIHMVSNSRTDNEVVARINP